jgi:hypothetical protein
MDRFVIDGEYIVWIVLAAVSLALAVVYACARWADVRPLMDVKSDALRKLERRGGMEESLEEQGWDRTFRATLERARRDFEQGGSDVSRGVAAAIGEVEEAAGLLSGLVRRAAMRALSRGDLGSVLVRIDPGLVVYALAIPARADDVRALRRCTAFADGWSAHVEAVRRAAAGAKPPRLLGLGYCLDPQGGAGALVVSYEDEGRRVATAPLADGTSAASGPAGRYDFRLADVARVGHDTKTEGAQ